MKKTLLTILAIAPLGLFAQTTILSDNFDAYSVPGTVAVAGSTLWQTWSGASGGAEDAAISDSIFSSANNSMYVKNGGPSVFLNDMILAFPSTYTSGNYVFSLKLYVPQGSGGYFNLGGAWTTGGTGYQYGGDFFFNADGSGNVDLASTLPFTYNVAAWNDISVLVSLGLGTKTLTVNGTVVGTRPWTAASGFGAVDIFGIAFTNAANATQVTSKFYVDDVSLVSLPSGAGLEENNLDAQVLVYPSPNNGQFNIEFKEALSPEYNVTITDLSGKVIETSSVLVNGATTASFNLNVSAGVYLINISNNETRIVQKFTVQ
jgi:hypothetical protein